MFITGSTGRQALGVAVVLAGAAMAAGDAPSGSRAQAADASTGLPTAGAEPLRTASAAAGWTMPVAVATLDNHGSPLLADPTVPRPAGTPCVVTLLDNVALDDTSNHQAFAYAPPLACSGAWAKVVLVGDYRYDPLGPSPNLAGIALWLNGVNLHLGGTPWADDNTSTWHVERDLTDYTPLFRRAGTGRIGMPADFFPYLSTTHLRVSVQLLVYPATSTAPAPRKADAVYALGGAESMADPLQNRLILSENQTTYPASKLASTLTLPRNIERAYLDVLVYGTGGYPWWSCPPSQYFTDLPGLFPGPYPFDRGSLGHCTRGAFREAQVSIDGQPAGVAPVYPWIPAFALRDHPMPAVVIPIPAPRALNLLPYRVDLSPFAGLLSDGRPHEIAVTGASGEAELSLSAAATLLVYRDPRSARVSGAVTRNTLAGQAPRPSLADTLQQDAAGRVTGGLVTTLRRTFVIDGYIDTARGRIQHRVAQTVHFANTQRFDNLKDDAWYRYQQDVRLVSKVWRHSYSTLGSTQLLHDYEYFSYPLHALERIEHANNAAASGTPDSTGIIEQQYAHQGWHERPNIVRYTTGLQNRFSGVSETSVRDGVFNMDRSSTQGYRFTDNRGSCYDRVVVATGWQDRDQQDGASCPDGVNRLRSIARPDGAAESIGWAGW